MADLSFNFALDNDSLPTSIRRPNKGGKWANRAKVKQTAARKAKPKADAAAAAAASQPALTVAPDTSNVPQQQQPQPRKTRQEPVAGPSNLSKPSARPTRVISSLFSSREHLEAPTEPSIPLNEAEASNAPTEGTFAGLGLLTPLLNRLASDPTLQLERPTAIQQAAIPTMLKNINVQASSSHDFVIKAQTGSGKTLAYLLPVVQSLLLLGQTLQRERGIRLDRSVGTLAIILVPTRELAQQVYQVALSLLSFTQADKKGKRKQSDQGLKSNPEKFRDTEEQLNTQWLVPGLLSGGMHRQHEKARLRKGVPLLIATPGRLIDHLETTSSFKIAGDIVKQRRKKHNDDADDNFDVEDKPFEPTPGVNGQAQEAEISSDEDFEKLAKSKANRAQISRDRDVPKVISDPRLTLRWLVLDEADRLMDMGFEPQIQKIVTKLDEHLDLRKFTSTTKAKPNTRFYDATGKPVPTMDVPLRTSVLCSATMDGAVTKLAGSILRDVVRIDAGADESSSANAEQQASAPAQLTQYSIVAPPKLRFVGLLSLLRSLFLTGEGDANKKALVFLSCTDVVDFYFEAFGSIQMGGNQDKVDDPTTGKTSKADANKLVANCMLLPNTPILRLHGNLDMQTRINSLKTFTKSSSGILLCTSLASRGLDVPFVRYVIQYDLPTEGGVKEYIHRVGRTARAGQKGESWAFVLPSEQEWCATVSNAPNESNDSTSSSSLQPIAVTNILQKGLGGTGQQTETRATDIQMAFERWVEQDERNATLAKNAFVSHVRAYATHPSAEKHIFHVRLLHLGHLAKSFGLREAPAGLGRLVASKAVPAPTSAGTNGKRKVSDRRGEDKDSDDTSTASDSEVEREPAAKRPKIPKSGRAITAKRMRAVNTNDRSEFSIGNSADLERMLSRR